MKAAKGFILRNVVGEYILMPVDDKIAEFNGTVLMNKLSAFVWEKLQTSVSREEILGDILQEFEIDEATAAKDLDELLAGMQELGILEADEC